MGQVGLKGPASPAVVIQARMASVRFPGKVLADLNGKPVLQHVIERCRESSAESVWVAIGKDAQWTKLADACTGLGAPMFVGEADDVLQRYLDLPSFLDPIVRVCSDCPLIDPWHIDILLNKWRHYQADYISFSCSVSPHLPPRPGVQTKVGLPELITRKALQRLLDHASSMHEHVTYGVYEKPAITPVWIPFKGDATQENTIDTPEDLERIAKRCKCSSAATL